MRTNVLIHRAGLSEVNKMTFANPGPDKVFGVPKMADPEGARDVTMVWKSHVANPNDVPGVLLHHPSVQLSASSTSVFPSGRTGMLGPVHKVMAGYGWPTF